MKYVTDKNGYVLNSVFYEMCGDDCHKFWDVTIDIIMLEQY